MEGNVNSRGTSLMDKQKALEAALGQIDKGIGCFRADLSRWMGQRKYSCLLRWAI